MRGIQLFDAVCAEVDGEPCAAAFVYGIDDDACAKFGVADIFAEGVAVVIARGVAGCVALVFRLLLGLRPMACACGFQAACWFGRG